MHPASSVIVFTTLSGAGYGLLGWLGLYAAAGLLPMQPLFAIVAMLAGLGSVTVGLLSSTLHLGHPERAWRALSQWRTSWLSREGVASIVTYGPAVLFGFGWVIGGALRDWLMPIGPVLTLCAIVTVICTAFIYRSLKPIPRWSNGWVVPNYLALAAMTGALLLAGLARLFNVPLPWGDALAGVAVIVALVLKLGYWWSTDRAKPVSTPESATGLGAIGTVRLFEAPHTSENYLLKEMGYRIARKHAAKLRVIAVVLSFLVPLALLGAAYQWPMLALPFTVVAPLVALVGVLTERWLFFAEARHVVTLYYGRRLDAVG